MTSQANWRTVAAGTDGEREFFNERQWNIIEAATARIIPTDQEPGAREAGVVRFIDRYLAGHIYASADGSGFLELAGKDTEVWAMRVEAMRQRYTKGITRPEETSRTSFGRSFTDLGPEEQDQVLVAVSGQPKPPHFAVRFEHEQRGGVAAGSDDLPRERNPPEGCAPPTNQPIPDDELEFFPMLVLHTRQRFYSDPAYGGNRDHIGWKVIGFAGPSSLAQTQQGKYSTIEYLLPDVIWPFAEETG